MKPDWETAYNILMDYWEYIPEEDQHIVDQKLKIALNEHNRPLKILSQDSDSIPKDCIKKSLKRLKDEFGFGKSD